jgi:hypothetical protein
MFEYWLLGPVVLRTIPKRGTDTSGRRCLVLEEAYARGSCAVDTSAGLDLLEQMVAECRRIYEGNDTCNG